MPTSAATGGPGRRGRHAPSYRILLLLMATSALAVGLTALPRSDPAGSNTYGPPDRFSCRASLARVETVAGPVEPVTANEAGDPCATDRAGGLNETTVVDLPPTVRLTAEALAVDTVDDERASGSANAAAAHLELRLGSVVVTASVLTATAGAVCPGPALSSDSTVLNLTVGGTPVDVPSGQGHKHVSIPAVGTLHVNEAISTGAQVVRRALWLEPVAGGSQVVVAEAVADFHGDPCGPVAVRNGFMTGGGKLADATAHGLRLACDAAAGPSNLQVESGSTHFHLDAVTSARCTDHPRLDPGSPAAPFDTLEGNGTGRCNGGPAKASWKATDAGEPGRSDMLTVAVTGSCSFTASGTLRQGNHQAHAGT